MMAVDMPVPIEQSRILLTGASSGIGAATARRLARAGAAVGLVGRHPARLATVAEQCRRHNPATRAWLVDLADPEATARLAGRARDELGELDAVVNIAGTPMRRHVRRLRPAEVYLATRVNYLAPVQLILALLPGMLARGRGAIVNVGSSGGRIGTPGQAAYAGSKFALSGFTEVLAIDLAGTGVRVRLIQPGPIDTPLWEAAGNDPPLYAGQRWPPELVAEAVATSLVDNGPFERFIPSNIVQLVREAVRDPDRSLSQRAAWAAERGATPRPKVKEADG